MKNQLFQNSSMQSLDSLLKNERKHVRNTEICESGPFLRIDSTKKKDVFPNLIC